MATIQHNDAAKGEGSSGMARVRAHLLNRAMALYWHLLNAPWPRRLRGGTCFAVRTSQRLFGVTAAHVIRDYEASKARGAPLVVQLCDVLFNIEGAIIAIDDRLDVATFELTEEQLRAVQREAFNVGADWPPPAPVPGDMIGIIGFPEVMRERLSSQHSVFKAYAAFEFLQDIGERELVLAVDPEQFQYAVTETGMPPIDLNLSGASGGPAVLYRKVDGIVSCWPVAAITQGKGTSSDGATTGFVMIRCRRIDKLNADGSLAPNNTDWLPT
jgi:hypothetical protein